MNNAQVVIDFDIHHFNVAGMSQSNLFLIEFLLFSSSILNLVYCYSYIVL